MLVGARRVSIHEVLFQIEVSRALFFHSSASLQHSNSISKDGHGTTRVII